MADEDTKRSVFNAGIAQAERVHYQQEQINLCNSNPFLINPFTLTYNFQTIISSLNCLLMETWGKLDKDERETGDKLRKAIEIVLIKYPVIRLIPTGNGEELVQDINYYNYYTYLNPILIVYEKAVKDFLEAHDMNSPNKTATGFF